MERLNLRQPSKYDYSDEAECCEQNINFYCVSEGPTEESYLYGLRNNKKELQIRNNVIIQIIEKTEENKTFSYPLQLVNACLYNMGCIKEDGTKIPRCEWNDNCKWEGYKREIDKVCVLFDRDFRGLETVLPNLIHICQEYGIEIVMSNPNFELWLLMHFPNIEKYDKEVLKRNQKNLNYQIDRKASKKKKFLEIEVGKSARGYTKGSKIKFERFIGGIDLAIEQASLFEEEIEGLVDKIGTTMGKLIKKMRTM